MYRPINAPKPAFDFGHLRIAGDDSQERSDFVIKQSHTVVTIGGGSGTKAVIERAEKFGKLVVPVGVGSISDAWRFVTGGGGWRRLRILRNSSACIATLVPIWKWSQTNNNQTPRRYVTRRLQTCRNSSAIAEKTWPKLLQNVP